MFQTPSRSNAATVCSINDNARNDEYRTAFVAKRAKNSLGRDPSFSGPGRQLQDRPPVTRSKGFAQEVEARSPGTV